MRILDVALLVEKCERVGRPVLSHQRGHTCAHRFATHHARGEHEDELDELIGAWAAGHTAAELDALMDEAGVVCAPVYSAADIYADPHFRERGLLVDHTDDVHGQMTVPGVVPKLSGTPGTIRSPAPWTVGADTDAVLAELEQGPGPGP